MVEHYKTHLASNELFNAGSTTVVPIRKKIDGLAPEEQINVTHHVMRPWGIERKSVCQRVDRRVLPCLNDLLGLLKIVPHLVVRKARDLSGDVNLHFLRAFV